jgi:hypothetical protein
MDGPMGFEIQEQGATGAMNFNQQQHRSTQITGATGKDDHDSPKLSQLTEEFIKDWKQTKDVTEKTLGE